jgi:branched-chain amino acid transport system permease protein
VVGGNAFVTEPGMAGTVGAIVFVVIVIGGMGSLAGAFIAALLIGLLENFGKAFDYTGLKLLSTLGLELAPDAALYPVLKLTMAQVAPVLPYLLLVVILIVRPKGLLGTRED